MSDLEKHLLPGESLLFRTRLHWSLYVPPVLFTLFVAVPIAVLLFVNALVPWIAAPLVVGFSWLLAAHIRRASSEFAVTNKRVVIRVGVFTTRSQELLPSKIEGVGVEQTMWGKLFGFGDIEVTGSGGTRERFAAIQAPLEFRRAIQQATDGHATQV